MFKKKKESKDKRFKETAVETYHYGLVMVLIDKVTGVHYLHTWAPQGVTLTPLLDEHGDVVIDKNALET